MQHVAVIRILSSVPLLALGTMHLAGAAPLAPILEGAGIPFPELNAVLAPIAQIAAGVLLLTGVRARIGALLALGTMAGALFAHLRFDWVDEPTLLLPLAVVAGTGYVLVRGPGCLWRCAPEAPNISNAYRAN
jgi:uncharacterized membrane protein YphA (DoxX/SURF4 family)